MSEERKFTIHEFHSALGPALFNKVWELMEKSDRTVEETDEMIHAAHASWYHWSKVGGPVNLARAEWQISRMYTVIGRPESALSHAERCLGICLAYSIGDFDLAYAYEAVARAHAMSGRLDLAKENVAKALKASEAVVDPQDLEIVLADIKTILPEGEQ
ncbi:MAG: hypothetical protein Kow00107_09130 [Planctomycetota bacterium]